MTPQFSALYAVIFGKGTDSKSTLGSSRVRKAEDFDIAKRLNFPQVCSFTIARYSKLSMKPYTDTGEVDCDVDLDTSNVRGKTAVVTGGGSRAKQFLMVQAAANWDLQEPAALVRLL